MSFLSMLRIVVLWFLLNLQKLHIEKPLQSPRRMTGKNKIDKELLSLSEDLQIGKGRDGEEEVPCN